MSLSLQPTPSSAAQRGAASIQPAYFTSSLFVDALREDISQLSDVYSHRYRLAFLSGNNDSASTSGSSSNDSGLRPFGLFKEVWMEQGWQWLHLKMLEPRARETFVSVVLRTFLGQCTSLHNRRSLYLSFNRIRGSKPGIPDAHCGSLWVIHILHITTAFVYSRSAYSQRHPNTNRCRVARLL